MHIIMRAKYNRTDRICLS